VAEQKKSKNVGKERRVLITAKGLLGEKKKKRANGDNDGACVSDIQAKSIKRKEKKERG